ncbi:MAG: MlaD family protein [Candidatus Gastranaerophilales bacterium]|nr:MlaD family protein [Candidatus Gastranaerophilales bacterium]
MRFSSSFKVGILTLAAIIILVFTVLWVKGRTLSGGERFAVEFKDINGMRVGSGVQMMGVRIGQVEELVPKIEATDSGVIVKFVITEPNIQIPTASSISIQQSGIIGEQFLEITPPQLKTIYLPVRNSSHVLHINDKVQMLLSKKMHDVGLVKQIEIVDTSTLPLTERQNLKTKLAYKVGYIINLPGLILPDYITGKISLDGNNDKLRIAAADGAQILFPQTKSKYTIIEPMRLSDFMKLQYRSAESLAETNERLSLLLSDDVIADLKQSAKAMKELTLNANTTFEKAQVLIDTSKNELLTLSSNADMLAAKISTLADNLNAIAGDKELINNISTTSKSVNRLSNNLNKIIEDPKTKVTLANLDVTTRNVAEISGFVNDMTKDPALKSNISNSVIKLNTALDKLSVTLDTVNSVSATPEDREKIKATMADINVTSSNLKKFSEKLNKRFLLFRLLF